MSQECLNLSWKHVVVKTANGQQVLLRDICGQVQGKFLAIMGASGSGKTTFLNMLARRSDKGILCEGETYLNGNPYGNPELKRLTGYVMQDDQLNEKLTVEETLLYTAHLRMSPLLSAQEKKERVDEVLKQMGLDHCRDLMVGDRHHKGIPGGERKRLCTAIELLTRPRLLFLDEPTTSLDSYSALSLCTKLKAIAHSGACTIVCTIHQPQSKIFELFDDLLLLSKGRLVYHGPASTAIDAFASAGYPCPTSENPADHILDVAVNNPNVEIDYNPISPLNEKNESHTMNLDIDWNRISWFGQFLLLYKRSSMEIFRSKTVVFTQIITVIIMAVLIGGTFFNIGTDQKSVTKRNPVIFFCMVNQGLFGSLQVINSFPSERILVLRERAAGTYYVSAYFVAKSVAQTIQCTVPPIIFSCIVYWMVGLQRDFGKFIIFTVILILGNLSCVSMALAISAFCHTTTFSLIVLPFVLEIFRLFGGYFLSPADLPIYFSWLDAFSCNKYAYVGAALNELKGLQLHCNPGQYTNNGTICPITNGETTIDKLGLNKLSVELCIGVLIIMMFGYRFIAYLGLRFYKY